MTERPRRDCTHANVHHTHGTLQAYKADKCRCPECTAANTASGDTRRRLIAYGRYDNGYSNAEPVREHIRHLKSNGISEARLAAIAGLNPSYVGTVMRGHKCAAPPVQILKKNATSILAVQPTLENINPLRAIDATGTRRRLQALMAIGHSQTSLGRRLNTGKRASVNDILDQRVVTKAKHLQIVDLYNHLWDKPPTPKTRHQQTAKTKTINYAKARGWLPPLAWDEDQMDNPDHHGYPEGVAA